MLMKRMWNNREPVDETVREYAEEAEVEEKASAASGVDSRNSGGRG